MRTMHVILLIIGAVVILGGAAGWLACGGWKSVATRFEDDASTNVAISEIRITGRSMWVQVRQGAGPGVQIHRTAYYLNPFHPRPAPTHRVDGTVLQLGDDASSFSAMEYVVLAPAGVRISADVGTGSLDVAGVSTVDATVQTGAVTVADATGQVTARVGTGAITGIDLRSDAVVASTGTGQISLELAKPADVDATASTGSVDVKVPAASYRVDASSRLGKVDLGIPNDPAGLYRLVLRTGTGGVTLAAY